MNVAYTRNPLPGLQSQWEQYEDENGLTYYFNPATEETAWTLPQGQNAVDMRDLRAIESPVIMGKGFQKLSNEETMPKPPAEEHPNQARKSNPKRLIISHRTITLILGLSVLAVTTFLVLFFFVFHEFRHSPNSPPPANINPGPSDPFTPAEHAAATSSLNAVMSQMYDPVSKTITVGDAPALPTLSVAVTGGNTPANLQGGMAFTSVSDWSADEPMSMPKSAAAAAASTISIPSLPTNSSSNSTDTDTVNMNPAIVPTFQALFQSSSVQFSSVVPIDPTLPGAISIVSNATAPSPSSSHPYSLFSDSLFQTTNLNGTHVHTNSIGSWLTPQYVDMIRASIGARVFLGLLLPEVGPNQFSMNFGNSTSITCILSYFFGSNEANFVPENVQFAIQCLLTNDFDMKQLMHLQGVTSGMMPNMTSQKPDDDSWIDDFNLKDNVTITVSSASHTIVVNATNPALSSLPLFIDAGVSIQAQAQVSPDSPTFLSGIDKLFSIPLSTIPAIGIQFSVPFELVAIRDPRTGALLTKNLTAHLSTTIPIRGRVWIDQIGLAFPADSPLSGAGDSSALSTGANVNMGVSLYVEGINSTLTSIAVSTAFVFSTGSTSIAMSATGVVDRINGLVTFDAQLLQPWSPFTGMQANGMAAASGSNFLTIQKAEARIEILTNAFAITPSAATVVVTAAPAMAVSVTPSAASGSNPTALSMKSLGIFGVASFQYHTLSAPAVSVQLNFTAATTTPASHPDYLLIVTGLPVTDIVTLLDDIAASTGIALDALKNNFDAITGGNIAFTASSYDTSYFSPILNQQVAVGIGMMIEGVTVPAGVFNGALDLANQINGTFNSIYSVSVILPINLLTGSIKPNQPLTISFSASDFVVTSSFEFAALTFVLTSPLQPVGTAVPPLTLTIQATCNYNLDPTVLTFNADIAYTGVSGMTPWSLKFDAALPSSVNPFGSQWLELQNTKMQALITGPPVTALAATNATHSTATPPKGSPTVDLAFTSTAIFHFSTTPSPPLSVSFASSPIKKSLVLYLSNIRFADFYPSLASTSGLAQAEVDVIITNQDQVQLQKELDDLTNLGMNPVARAGDKIARAGINIFAVDVPVDDNAFNGVLNHLNQQSYSGFAFNFTIHTPLPSFATPSTPFQSFSSLPWDFTMMTANPIPFSASFELEAVRLDMQLIPSPFSINTTLNSSVLVSVPDLGAPLEFGALGAYSSVGNNFTLEGYLPGIPAPFGQTFLAVGPTQLELSLYTAQSVPHRSVSLHSSAVFRDAVPISLCGMVDPIVGAAIIAKDLGTSQLASLICEIMNICNLQDNPIIIASGAENINFGVTLSSGDFTPAQIAGTLCSVPNSVKRGVSVFTNLNLNPAILSKVTGVLKGIEAAVQNLFFQFSVNIPFGGSSSAQTKSIDKMMKLYHEKGLVSEKRRQMKTLAMIHQFKTQSAFGSIAALNINFETDSLKLELGPYITLFGLGISSLPLATPPTFSLHTTFYINLKSNPTPLVFLASGTFAADGEVTVAGQLTDQYGWIDPFGIKGLIVYGAGIEVGFAPESPIGISKLGIGFSAKLGDNVVIAFSGVISGINVGDSYVDGLLADVNQPLALIDFVQAVVTMSGGIIKLPDPSFLPDANVLSLTKVSFAMATSSGTDLAGRPYNAGFEFTCIATIFGIQLNTAGGVVPRLLKGTPVTDFQLSLQADFTVFNNGIISWVEKLIPFGSHATFLSNTGLSLCDIACIKQLTFTNFSAVDIVTASGFPSISITISIIGKEVTFGNHPLNFALIKGDLSGLFNEFKSAFSFHFCLVNAQCPSATPICAPLSGFICVAKCPSGYGHLIGFGCVKIGLPVFKDQLAALRAAGQVLDDAGNAIAGAATKAGDAIAGAATKTGGAIAGAAKDAGNDIAGAAKKGASDIKNILGKLEEDAPDAEYAQE